MKNKEPKSFNGKAIYNPVGKAGEYTKWGCNLFVGCSNDCNYCYCKKYPLSKYWTNKPYLKKSFKDEENALQIFSSELKQNIKELQKNGLFFTFTSDPMLQETKPLVLKCIDMALEYDIPVQILTKRAEFAYDYRWKLMEPDRRKMIAFGFTLTGCDELEPGASSNIERIESMRRLHNLGYLTFASIEPVVDINKSFDCILQSSECCDLFKIGLMSGRNDYDINELMDMFRRIKMMVNCGVGKYYLKDSFVNYLKIDRNVLSDAFVKADYNIFTSTK